MKGPPEPQWRKALRERLAGQADPAPDSDPWTLIACRNLCALMSDKRDPVDHEMHEQLRAVAVQRGERSFVLTATDDGWRSHPTHPDLEVPLDMTVRLARRLRAFLADDTPDDPDTEELVRRYEDGETTYQIAAALDVTPAVVRNRLRERGVQMRPRGRRKPPNDDENRDEDT